MAVKLKTVSLTKFRLIRVLPSKVYIAKLGRTVGLKGQLKLHIDSDFPEQFSKNATFITNKNITLTIESFNKNNNVVKFIGFDNIDDVKKLINQQLFVTAEHSKQNRILKAKEYFWFDLVDCDIEENSLLLGKVIEIHRFPQGDYFEIQTSNGLIKDKGLPTNFLLPYDDKYIVNVDIKQKHIQVQNAFDILEAS